MGKTKKRRKLYFRLYVHVTSLRDKAEDAAVLLVEGPHVRGGSAGRGSQLADERLLCDLRQIAKAILTTRYV